MSALIDGDERVSHQKGAQETEIVAMTKEPDSSIDTLNEEGENDRKGGKGDVAAVYKVEAVASKIDTWEIGLEIG